jgi:uncharacterized protein (DUF1800 family)
MGKRNSLSHRRNWVRPILETTCLGLMTASMVAQPLAAADLRTTPAGLPSLASQKKWKEPMPEEKKVLQLLSRITFGARPGDVEQVQKIGLNAFLAEQLHPERIDDSAAEARVAALPSLSMSPEELVESYPAPKQAAKLAEGKDAQRAAQIGKPSPLSSEPEQKIAPPNSNPEQSRNQLAAAPTTPQAPAMMEPQGPQRVIMELAQEEVLRAVYSNRQLQELMVQFWMNHFNIFAPKGADRWMTTSFERDTIRPRALGKFEDLLVATAQSPAMLFYLDNWMSTTPNPTYPGNAQRSGKAAPATRRGQYGIWRPFGPFGGRGRLGSGPFSNPQAPRPPARAQGQGQPNKQNRRGLNEDYAREVMELHTLGVEGGYTQRDVIEVARCLTGWTIDKPQKGGDFVFRSQMHDFGEKAVLHHKIKAGRGMEDGLEVLHLLARHPATARFISLKLCRRFVSDDPPPALVDRGAKTFLKTNGDIRQVLKTILTSPEFYSEAAYRAKVKSPLELVVSAVRALGGQTDASVQLVQMIARMGQPMFQYQAPTGFPDRAGTWINSGTLLIRINFATLLAANRIRGTEINWNDFAQPQGDPVQELAARLVGGDLTQQTLDAIRSLNRPDAPASSGPPPQNPRAMVAGLLLASPEFQRR